MGIPIADVVTFVLGDRARTFTATLVSAEDGETPVDLTGNTVRLKLYRASDETLLVDAAATIDSATLGQVSYAWTALDVAAIGTEAVECWAYWIRTDAGGLTEHFPGQRERLKVCFIPAP